MSRWSNKARVPGKHGFRIIRLLAAVEGVSTIEFALIGSMLVTLAIGMLDFGMALWQQMEVGNARAPGRNMQRCTAGEQTAQAYKPRRQAPLASARLQRRRRRYADARMPAQE
jgi:Flp pilus assembly protein TadG